jgi:hypothetical protein
MSGLRYHYSNPKFDGLPWPAGKQPKRRKVSCCKKVYSQQEAQRECADLRASNPERNWFYRFCFTCDGFHIGRGS